MYGTVTIPLHSPPRDVVAESAVPEDDTAGDDDDLQFGTNWFPSITVPSFMIFLLPDLELCTRASPGDVSPRTHMYLTDVKEQDMILTAGVDGELLLMDHGESPDNRDQENDGLDRA